jgi:signal transduction histidine kinase
MIPAWLNWRTWLAVLAMVIVTGTIFYSQYLAQKIAREERAYVELWAEAVNYNIRSGPNDQALALSTRITNQNERIPIIQTDAQDRPTGTYSNLEISDAQIDDAYLTRKVAEFKRQHAPIRLTIGEDPGQVSLFYYGDSALLNEVRYYPLVQLLIVGLFIFITLNSLRTRHKAQQNQVWAGMAKETAHQLGTPVSSLEAWVELLREDPQQQKLAKELGRDVARLRLVSDRFGKIGSTPQLERMDLIPLIREMVDYMRGRSSDKVQIVFDADGSSSLMVPVSATLFEWVIENLLKNALDALDGVGQIRVRVIANADRVWIEVSDTGRGISPGHVRKVFEPGFSTKKRGWGLGLSLAKRIIEQYHGGELSVFSSEIGKGTTFRIVLNAKTA